MKFKLMTETATPPSKANVWDAGWDLYCDEHVAIMPGMRQMIKTGLALDIPQGHVGMIWPRSGLAARFGLDVLGGVVDSGYQGEVLVIMVNHGNFTYSAAPGTRIAQIVFQPIMLGAMIETEEFSNPTTRGEKGFGSSGS